MCKSSNDLYAETGMKICKNKVCKNNISKNSNDLCAETGKNTLQGELHDWYVQMIGQAGTHVE